MKKNLLSFGTALSREQAKGILGGDSEGTPQEPYTYTCRCNNEAALGFTCTGDCFGAAWYMCRGDGATCTIS